MTLVRPATDSELPAMVRYPDDPERNAATREYLAGLLAKECTRPQWCLVAEDAGRLVGSVALWAFPGNDVPRDLILLEAPWSEPELRTGRALLAAAVDLARSLGATELGHVLDSPVQGPQFQRHPERRTELLQLAGFEATRDGRRFRRTAGPALPPADPRLTFRALPEVGRGPFIDLLELLLADTADAALAADVKQHGLRRAAEILFAEMEEFDYDPAWWELGYDADGTPATIGLPARSPAFPVIGFVGVSPAHRGKGYAASVVARGTRHLARSGADEIRGDCDAANLAMVKAFQRAGYENFANRLEFARPL
jgi:RimJ/RimL family protein N-acetyltransferase